MNVKIALPVWPRLSVVLALLIALTGLVAPVSTAAPLPSVSSSGAVQSAPTKKMVSYCSAKTSWKKDRALEACVEDLNGEVGAKAKLYKRAGAAKVQKAKVVFKFQHLWDGANWEKDNEFVHSAKRAINKHRKVKRLAQEHIIHDPGVFSRVVVTFKFKVAGKWHKVKRATPVVALHRDWGE